MIFSQKVKLSFPENKIFNCFASVPDLTRGFHLIGGGGEEGLVELTGAKERRASGERSFGPGESQWLKARFLNIFF